VGTIALTVPRDSSGLATLGETALSRKHPNSDVFHVPARSLESELADVSLTSAYIKIDIEGFEYQVIDSSRELFSRDRPIVGFEALSRAAAEKCCSLFDDYRFYCTRFNFLEDGGALTNSLSRIVGASIFGGSIDLIKFETIHDSKIDNFSQVFSVPSEKASRFENALGAHATRVPVFDLGRARSWSSVEGSRHGASRP
jgi:hypothetical protein